MDRQETLAWMRRVCAERGWTLNQWAKAAGVTPPALYRFRNGDHGSISETNIAKLMRAASNQTGL
jgi:transcriptional regulator with XRE-family HTH domain